jgi:hypothetical protein
MRLSIPMILLVAIPPAVSLAALPYGLHHHDLYRVAHYQAYTEGLQYQASESPQYYADRAFAAGGIIDTMWLTVLLATGISLLKLRRGTMREGLIRTGCFAVSFVACSFVTFCLAWPLGIQY